MIKWTNITLSNLFWTNHVDENLVMSDHDLYNDNLDFNNGNLGFDSNTLGSSKVDKINI